MGGERQNIHRKLKFRRCSYVFMHALYDIIGAFCV